MEICISDEMAREVKAFEKVYGPYINHKNEKVRLRNPHALL